MEPVLNSAMCRCCASEGTFKDIHTRYHWMGDEEVYSVMLKECFDITLSSPQGDEGGICEVCITQLRNAFNFKKQVLHTEEQFQHLLPNKVQEIKMEYTKDSSEEPEDRPVSAADNSDSDFTPSIKEEDDEALESKSKTKKRAVKSTAARSKKPKLEAPETSTQSIHRIPKTTALMKKMRTAAGGRLSVRGIRSRSAAVPRVKSSNMKREETFANPEGESVSLKTTDVEQKVGKNTSKSLSNAKIKTKRLEKVRHNTLQILKYTNATPIRGHNGAKYRCVFCNEAYVNPNDLKSHTIEAHEHENKEEFVKEKGLAEYLVKLDITSLHCKLCNLDCKTIEDIFEHLVKVHDIVIHKDIKSQILPFKFDGENLTCFVCQNFSTSFKMLQSHMLTHFGDFHCDTCGRGFGNSRKLTQHQKSHYTGVFACDKCEKVFDSAEKRKMHIVRVHTRPKLYKCGFCGEKFQSYDEKLKHLVAKHDVPSHTFKCHLCDKGFRKAGLLSLHTRKDHLMERQQKCPECGKAYFEPRLLKQHMALHNPNAPKIQCDLCLKYFRSIKSLKAHMKIHLDDRRFKCEQCNMAFVHKVSWKSHMKSKHDYEVPVGAK